MISRLRAVFGSIIAISVSASITLASEPFWLSEPGLCEADDGVIEEMDVIYLTGSGINSHYFSCTWPTKAGQALLRGDQSIDTKAKCANATGTWDAEFEIVRQEDGSVRVFQESGGITPVRFFRCG